MNECAPLAMINETMAVRFVYGLPLLKGSHHYGLRVSQTKMSQNGRIVIVTGLQG